MIGQKDPKDPITSSKAKAAASAPTDWTVIVYMAGDNNLSEDMITALNDMRRRAPRSNIKVLALYDSAYPPVPVAFYDFSKRKPGTCLRDFTDPNDLRSIQRPQPQRPGSDPYRYEEWKEFVKLKKFVPWVLRQRKYRSSKYALLLSGHSDGVLGRTILRDDNPPNALNLTKLAEVLDTCRKALPASTHPDQKFDILGFDGCLMGMVETAYELKNYAKVMISSEGNIPDAGWNYELVIDAFKAGGSTKVIAEKIVHEYSQYNRDFITSGRAVNISAYNLSEAESFAKKIDEFAGILNRLLKIIDTPLVPSTPPRSIIATFFRERLSEVILRSHLRSQTFMHNQAVDVMDFFHNIIDRNLQFQAPMKILFPQILPEIINPVPISKLKKGALKTALSFLGTPDAEIDELLAIWMELGKLYKSYEELAAIYGNFVIQSCYTGAEYQFSRGVSIFFPWSQIALNMHSSQYESLQFDQHILNWRLFFRKYVDLTMRTPETTSFFKYLDTKKTKIGEITFTDLVDFALLSDKNGKEYIGKEYIGKEYIGKGDAFYGYFSEFRNYSHFKKCKTGEEVVDIHGCNKVDTL